MPTRINVRPAQREALAPLYHRHGDCEPDTAVIRLNVASGEITYIYRDHQDTRNNLGSGPIKYLADQMIG